MYTDVVISRCERSPSCQLVGDKRTLVTRVCLCGVGQGDQNAAVLIAPYKSSHSLTHSPTHSPTFHTRHARTPADQTTAKASVIKSLVSSYCSLLMQSCMTTGQFLMGQGSIYTLTPAPKIWKSLRRHILQSQTLSSFRRHLKTHYFQSPTILSASAHSQCDLTWRM